ncbi:MAG: adenylate/guanylate cyclase domain-containing protein [Armatimonadota bacterium]|nr:adenylate/guanylate cyclase domain-containing protein [Armatimonadota bacterium]
MQTKPIKQSITRRVGEFLARAFAFKSASRPKSSSAQDPVSLQHVQPVSPWRRLAQVTLIFVLTVGICSALNLDVLNDAEQYAYNLRMRTYSAYHKDVMGWAKKQIVLVPLSDDTFNQENGAAYPGPPVPRDYHATVVRELTRAGARLIVFDMIFDHAKLTEDRVFAAAIRESGRVLLACLYENEDIEPHLAEPTAILQAAGARIGHIHFPQNIDRPVVDQITAIDERDAANDPTPFTPKANQKKRNRRGAKMIPALSLKAALMVTGLDGQPIQKRRDGWQIGNFHLPVNEDGKFNITYFGRPNEDDGGGFFPSVPYEDIKEGAVDDEFYKKTNFFKDKIIIIGDTTTLGNDFRYTPTGTMPGMEINAHATATMLAALVRHTPLIDEAPQWFNVIVICLLAALTCRFTAAWRMRRVAVSVTTLLLGYIVLNVWFFVAYGIYMHLVAPLLAILLATMGVLTERSLIEEREKNWMRLLLQRYVSPQVADYIVAHPEKCVLGGEQVSATVLFSDIRGFTKIARQLTPKQTVTMLNEYLQTMTDIVFKHEGTVDKYIGDAIMALFGIPVPYPDHARRAMATAIDMQAALLQLQERWRAQGLPAFDIGIGINTGEMVAGNMGASQRLDYTVIGDAVNFAAHVEALNKDLHTRILISESTYELVKDEVKAHGPLLGHVKNHGDDVMVYEVFGWRHSADAASAEASAQHLAGFDDDSVLTADEAEHNRQPVEVS